MREQGWVSGYRLLKVMHWAARSAHQEKVLESVGKGPKQLKIGRPAKAMLAVYREQIAAITRELSQAG